MENRYVFSGILRRTYSVGMLLVVSALFGTGTALAQNADGNENARTALEEILVTSRRREENLLDTPQSISAMTAEQMQVQGIHTIDDVTQYVPNVTLTSHGRANNTRIIIRGIGGGFPDPVFPFGAGMYIDGHYIPGSTGGYMSTVDIERVELLRGPQGTLFGKNVTGGAVNIITAKPSADFDSSLSILVGEDGEQNLRGMVNLPIADNLYARIGLASETFDGYYHNQNLDIDSGFTESTSARVALRWEPTDQLTFDAVATVARQRDDNNGGQCIGYGSEGDAPQWGGGAGNLERRLYTGAEADFVALCQADMDAGDFVNSSEHFTFSDVDEETINLGVEWEAADPGSWDSFGIKAKAGFRTKEYTYLADRDYVSWPVDGIGTVGPNGINSDTTSFELLFEGVVNDRFQFTAGFNYFDDTQLTGNDQCYDQFVAGGGDVAGATAAQIRVDGIAAGDDGDTIEAAIAAIPFTDVICTPVEGSFFELVPNNVDGTGAVWPEAPRLNGGGPGPFFQNVSVFNESKAVFAHGTYQINDDWKLDFGGRYTVDDRSFTNIEFATSCDLPNTLTGVGYHCEDGIVPIMNVDTVLLGGFFNKASETYEAFTPMASLTYNLPEGGIIYGLYSEGFLTGGFNTEINAVAAAELDVLTYDPEEVLNYELGYKGRILNDSVEISSAIFYMDYQNQQDQQQIDNSDGSLGADDTIGITQNVASSSIYGLEVEIRAIPWDGGFVTLDLGYLQNEYDEYNYVDPSPGSATFGEVLDFSDVLIHDYTPEWKVNLAVDHQFQLAGGTITPRLNLHYETGYDFGAGEGWTESDPRSSCYRDSYVKTDARVTYQPASGDWQLAAIGGNLTDERILEFCDSNRSVWRTRLERPRYFGLEFSTHFGN